MNVFKTPRQQQTMLDTLSEHSQKCLETTSTTPAFVSLWTSLFSIPHKTRVSVNTQQSKGPTSALWMVHPLYFKFKLTHTSGASPVCKAELRPLLPWGWSGTNCGLQSNQIPGIQSSTVIRICISQLISEKITSQRENFSNTSCIVLPSPSHESV